MSGDLACVGEFRVVVSVENKWPSRVKLSLKSQKISYGTKLRTETFLSQPLNQSKLSFDKNSRIFFLVEYSVAFKFI